MPTYFLTWTTYGSWLHGDKRGSVTRQTNRVGTASDGEDADRSDRARRVSAEDAFVMDRPMRDLVARVIRAHCEHRDWRIHALNVRTNHVHVVVSAGVKPETVMGQLKAWSSRRLHEHLKQPDRRIWTRHGSTRWIDTDASFRRAIQYVMDEQ
ncbi:MAG TPA: hypothetical protein ENK57_24870 [Polyangiaceae bacterium]|nr:hypothetical protein [Polyangiaceae bacterium]